MTIVSVNIANTEFLTSDMMRVERSAKGTGLDPYTSSDMISENQGRHKRPHQTCALGAATPAEAGQHTDAAEAGLTGGIVSTIMSIPAMVSSVVAAFSRGRSGYHRSQGQQGER